MAAITPKPQKKYHEVFETLRAEIASGLYPSGHKLPSEAALGRRFQTSRITVGRAVRELQQRNLVERRAGSGTYVKSPSKDSLSFGLLIPDLARCEIFEPICQGLADAPSPSRHVLIWGRGASSDATEARREHALGLCEQYISRKVSGVFMAPLELPDPADRTNEKIISSLEKARIPVILLDRDYVPYPRRSHHDLVGIDNRRTGHRATAHLLQLGVRRIGFVAYPTPAATIQERIAGYREALYSAGRPVDPSLIVTLSSESPRDAADLLAPLGLDGIVCANDPTAGRVMQGLSLLGRRVPQDVRIIGIDDVRYAALLPVPLTTMHQPCREIGMAAMSAMYERLSRPAMPTRDILLECPMIVRDSCEGPST